jgi:hypothetical protein
MKPGVRCSLFEQRDRLLQRDPHFDAILNPAGFEPQKEQIRALLTRADVTAINLVTEDMIDSLVLTGTSEDVHCQLERFSGCFETLLLLSPTLRCRT